MRWIIGILPFVAFVAAAACSRDASPRSEPTPAPTVATTPTPDNATAAGMMATADVGSMGRYWLGEQAEGLTLIDASGFHDGDLGLLFLTYGIAAANSSPPGALAPCVYIMEVTTQFWQQAQSLATPVARIDAARVAVLGSEGAIYEEQLADHTVILTLRPVPQGAETPQPTPTPVPPDATTWTLEVQFPDAVLTASTNCESPDPYNSLEGMRRLASHLVRFEPP